ncbi:hypothetical protein K6119_15795 [Paracrocinitomix mangrovi]|uniref:hypothetical protein n=1 Tax=Paracrocinitomix mangrovi TaxID=2862509 RepID=UPI001C8DF2DF|nr:hypothetical protein [Paracrocinitomix mangrovi]UKN01193.1 hypothetical protein K6119_15795 [Paracrocinitomix mangrovi]
MELKEFISETIKQIADGLVEGNKYVQDNHGGDGIENGYKRVKFDIAITSNEESSNEASGKITVAQIFGAGASSSSSDKKQNYNRIEFDTQVHIDMK